MAFSYADLYRDEPSLRLVEGRGKDGTDSNVVAAILRVPKRDLVELQQFAAELMRHYLLDVRRWNEEHRGEEYPRFTAELEKAKVSKRPRIRVILRQRKKGALKRRAKQNGNPR